MECEWQNTLRERKLIVHIIIHVVDNGNFSCNRLACEQGEGGRGGGGGKGEEEKGACRNGQGFRFPNAANLCHVQINFSGRRHNNNS